MGVLLVGPGSGAEVQAVERVLDRHGVETTVWDVEQWPGDGSITVHQGQTGPDIRIEGTTVDADRFHTVYLRDLGMDIRYPEYESQLAERPLATINQLREYQAVFESILRQLQDRGVRLVNPLDGQRVHRHKPWQLSTLSAADVPVPETLTTTDPEAVTAFVDRLEDVVYKPVGGGGHAKPLSDDDLTDERLSLLSNVPVQFQERIDGDNIRVFVVDGTAVAAVRIISTALDYRADETETTVKQIPLTELDPAFETAAIDATRRLDLSFAGVDLIDATDRFCVLEANPSPMFATIDEQAGTSVAEELASHLDTSGRLKVADDR